MPSESSEPIPDDTGQEMEQQPQGIGLVNWATSLIWKLNPFKRVVSEPPQLEVCQPCALSSNTDPNQDVTTPTAEEALQNEDFEPVADIHQLIEDSRTDSEDEADDEETLAVMPEIQPSSSLLNRKSRSKSSELLRPPSRPRGSKVKLGPERRRTIKFDDIAVLLDAAGEGDLEEVKRLIDEEHVEVNMCNEKGVTALHRAAAHGQVPIMEYLLTHQVGVNVVDADSWTPLHVGASVGSLEAVKLLLRHGANAEALTDNGEMAGDLTVIPDILAQLNRTIKRKHTSEAVTALYDYTPAEGEESELAFKEGDKLTIRTRDDPDWWLAEHEGEKGYVPRIWVQ